MCFCLFIQETGQRLQYKLKKSKWRSKNKGKQESFKSANSVSDFPRCLEKSRVVCSRRNRASQAFPVFPSENDEGVRILVNTNSNMMDIIRMK